MREAAIARGGQLEAGSIVTLTLACDLRILFGDRAAAFLRRVVTLVEEPRS